MEIVVGSRLVLKGCIFFNQEHTLGIRQRRRAVFASKVKDGLVLCTAPLRLCDPTTQPPLAFLGVSLHEEHLF